MPVVSVFKVESLDDAQGIVKRLDGRKANNCWMSAQKSNYTDNEVFVQYWFNEDVEDGLKRSYSEQEAEEICTFLRQNGKTIVRRRVYCFINLLTKTLEVYRWRDGRTEEIAAVFEKLLDTKITPITLKPEALTKLYENHAVELSQVMFKNVDGLVYDIFRGKCLENNQKFRDYAARFMESLRIVSFRPRIRFLNGNNKYQVTVNGDKGTVRFSDQGDGFGFRPRFEVRQITFAIASILGSVPS